MSEYVSFWLAKAISDFLLCLGFSLAVVVVIFAWALVVIIKQNRCKHAQVFENRACSAICRSCGKNLGFIGTWRRSQPDTTESGK